MSPLRLDGPAQFCSRSGPIEADGLCSVCWQGGGDGGGAGGGDGGGAGNHRTVREQTGSGM